MERKIKTLLIISFSLTVITSVVSASDSPWVWRCDESRKSCSRGLASEMTADRHQPLDFMECKMICSDEGLLWPLPTGKFTLSKELVPISGILFKEKSNSFDKLSEFFEEVFQTSYMNSMKGDFQSADYANLHKANLFIEVHNANANEILTLDTDETYNLTIKSGVDFINVTISGRNYYGARHGLETLSQLISWNNKEGHYQMHKTAEIIDDSPSYRYRGVMVDTARNFMPVEKIKKVIDGMAHNKLNVLHWHISDAVSFPMELKSVPQLAYYGAYSPQQVYKEEDVLELVAYADLRGVMIVPELDAPRHAANGWQFGHVEGHGNLALCINELDDRCRGGVCGHLNPANPKLYDILELAYEDLTEMFPTELFHMGGDEVEFLCWRKSKEIVNWMNERKLDPNDDENMFRLWQEFQINATKRLQSSTPKKKIVLWTSSLTERPDSIRTLPPDNHIIQIWLSSREPGIADLIERGYEVIFSNSDGLYLDCGFGYYVEEGNSWCDPYKQWRTIYQNDPVKIYETLSQQSGEARRKRAKNVKEQILGSEIPAWSESIGPDSLETRIWPRGAAHAERMWTNPEGDKAWIEAEIRFVHHRERMVQRGIEAEALQPQWCHMFENRCRKKV